MRLHACAAATTWTQQEARARRFNSTHCNPHETGLVDAKYMLDSIFDPDKYNPTKQATNNYDRKDE